MEESLERPTRDLAIRALLGLTIAGIVAYWSIVFSGMATIEPLVPGYVDWYMAFPLADLWIAAAAAMSLVCLRTMPRVAGVFLGATGSALIFLGLNALLYGLRTGLLFALTPGELIEIAIKAYCLGVGAIFIAAGVNGSGATRQRPDSNIRLPCSPRDVRADGD